MVAPIVYAVVIRPKAAALLLADELSDEEDTVACPTKNACWSIVGILLQYNHKGDVAWESIA